MYKPLPKELRLGFSDIHDIGVFAKEVIPQGTNFGMTHLQFGKTLIRTPLGGFLNHSDNPNPLINEGLIVSLGGNGLYIGVISFNNHFYKVNCFF